MVKRERIWKASRTQEDRNAYKTARNTYGRALQHAKDAFFFHFLANAKGKEVFDAFRICQPRQPHRTPTMHHGKSQATQFEEKAALFRQTLFPPPPTYSPTASSSPTPPIDWVPFTNDEIQAAIFESAPGKAPGPDGLTFACLRNAYHAIPDRFHTLFRLVSNTGHHPHCWREATGVIIPKPGKADYTAVKSYRIVSLLNCLGKIAEKLAARRLAELCERHSLLDNDQMGGIRARCAQDAVLGLVHDIQLGWSQDHVTSALFLDVKGAFDNVSKARLLETLISKGFPTPLVHWVKEFMSERRIALAFDGDKEDLQPVDTGIPQGSPCSPILFDIYLTPLFDTVKRKQLPIRAPSFIDDVGITTTGRTEAGNVAILQQAATVAFDWAGNNAVAFGDSKSDLIHFTKRKNTGQTLLLPNGTTLQPSTVLRWLGIFLDQKLSFKTHVLNKCAAAERALSSMLRLSTTEKGLTVANMRQLYQACVVPVADFGSEIWWNRQRQDHYTQRLQRIQNRATRRILGAFRTTPTALLDLEAALPPVTVRLDANQRRFAARMLKLPATHPLVLRCPPGFHPASDPTLEETGTPWHTDETKGSRYSTQLIRVASTLRQWLNLAPNVETTTPLAPEPLPCNLHLHTAPTPPPGLTSAPHTRKTKAQAAQAHHRLLATLRSSKSTMIFYTDGSQLGGRTGGGVYQLDTDQTPEYRCCFSLGRTQEVFDAELTACLLACKKAVLRARQFSGFQSCWIFVDSLSAIQRLRYTRPGPGQAVTTTIHRQATHLQRLNIELHIAWVPGHVQIQGNEIADRLAKQGSKLHCPVSQQTTSHAFLRRSIRQQTLIDWNTQWERRSTALAFPGSPRRIVLPSLAHCSKNLASRLIQIRSGHGFFNAYLARIPTTTVLTPQCPCGNSSQTAEHIVLYCKRYREPRRRHLQSLIVTGPDGNRWIDIYSKLGTQQLLLFLRDSDACLRPQRALNRIPGMGDIEQTLD